MTVEPCPHCGARPYSLGMNVKLQTRCESCNGLIVISEEELRTIQARIGDMQKKPVREESPESDMGT